MRVIAYTYEADLHCLDCTRNTFGDDDLGYAFTFDNEDQLINPVFSTDEILDYSVCGDCSQEIGGE